MPGIYFQKSRVNSKGGIGFLRNRFRYMGFLDSSGLLNSDPGELVMSEGMSFNGHILDSYLKQGCLILPDGFRIEGNWHKNRLTHGKIRFPDICDIDSVSVNTAENVFSYQTKNGKAFAVSDGQTLSFLSTNHSVTVTFSLVNKNLTISVKVVPVQKNSAMGNYETSYLVRPSLRFTKSRHLPELCFTFDAYVNYKICYSTEQREENAQKKKIIKMGRCVIYPSGLLFFGQSEHLADRHEPMVMSGVLLDIDEYLLDKQGTKTFPHYDMFMYCNGHHLDKPSGEITKSRIESHLLGNIIENLISHKSVFTSLKKRILRQLSRNFDWSSYNEGYWRKLSDQKEAFHYKTSLSRPMKISAAEKELEPFDWTRAKTPFFGNAL